ncbi:2-oxobutyrate oxidase [Brevundimonas intermedia]|uniref:2-oxoglutarate-dependent ethylene/succinate-forming enzyme n=1 Tax=Brevundimonas intermedia TaxID=74315 RepID=A0ABQ5T541_9CAUL|nr:2-oxoglutarate and iron-dependent oxygenase domain-containing protein [Brevundimonas intermedia]GLK47676.1 2-oxobutyrate oxidase [Brevundimonas intermedia]
MAHASSAHDNRLPILDLGDYRGPADARSAFLEALRRALHDYGFFYLGGHGMDPQLVDGLQAAVRRFFALPLKDKLQIEMIRSPHFRGYTRIGCERTRGLPDWREQLDINTEAEPFPMTPDTPVWRRLQGPNQWPEAMPELRGIVLAYQAEATRVGIMLLEAIATALGQPERAFAEIYEPTPSQLMKLIRYPGRGETETAQGVGAHRDGGFITLLLQEVQPGLRVRAHDGGWIAAPPIPGTVVVNAGELLELATDGYVHAAIHDVIAPPSGSDRCSVAFFLGSKPDAVVPVLPLPEPLRGFVRGVSVDPLNQIFREVGLNQLKSRLRSHPDVADAHYPGLGGEEFLPRMQDR